MIKRKSTTPTDDNDERCEFRSDGFHCRCWYDGEKCCACGAAEMSDEQRREQGMVP